MNADDFWIIDSGNSNPSSVTSISR